MRRRLFVLFALGFLVFALNYTLRALPQLAAPSVVNVAANPGRSNSVITWTTSPAADGQVEYGLTTSCTNVSPLDATLVLSHAVTLVGLQPSTMYHFRVRSRDSAANITVLATATLGSRNITVTNADGQTANLAAGFSVTP